jgi:hypothetical protein
MSNQQISIDECNEWLNASENQTAPTWLRELVQAARDWAIEVRARHDDERDTYGSVVSDHPLGFLLD